MAAGFSGEPKSAVCDWTVRPRHPGVILTPHPQPVELQPLSAQELSQIITAAPQPTIIGSLVPTTKLHHPELDKLRAENAELRAFIRFQEGVLDAQGKNIAELKAGQMIALDLVPRQEHEEKLAEMGRAVEAWRNAAEARFARARECEDRMREQARVIAKQAAIILDLRKALMAPQPPPKPQAAQTERARQDAAVGRWSKR